MNGQAHARASCAVTLPAAIAAGVAAGPAFGAGVAVGCLSGVFISPDLDLETITISEGRLIWKFGPIGLLWTAYWWFYAWMIPHRSPMSHLPVLGTALRIAYLVGPALAIGALRWGWEAPIWPAWAWWLLGGWALGLALSDALHWLMDGCP